MIQSPRLISTTYIVCLRIELNGDLEVYAREVWPGRYLFSRVPGQSIIQLQLFPVIIYNITTTRAQTII